MCQDSPLYGIAAWRAVRQRIGFRGLPHARKGLFLFIALMRMVTFMMKVVHNLSVWALRACSYKTGSEALHQGIALHPHQGVYLGFCLASSNGFKRLDGFKRFKWFNGFKRFNGIILTTVFLFPLHSSSSQYHIPMSRTRTRNLYIR